MSTFAVLFIWEQGWLKLYHSNLIPLSFKFGFSENSFNCMIKEHFPI